MTIFRLKKDKAYSTSLLTKIDTILQPSLLDLKDEK